MGKRKYRYTGAVTVHLPTHGITAKGGDRDTVYSADEPINHPQFVEVKEEKRKEREQTTK